MTGITIEDLFYNDIKREINGVIKADQDDEHNVYTELEEYVVTKESLKHIDGFFERYLRSTDTPTDKIGVWISGDFGSGKSHFLKILSYLLENKEAGGKTALDFFRQKIQDPEILNTIEKSVQFGTKDVILFNIDTRSGASSERIVDILMRVFNEKRGYFGDVFWIAELEENLADKGLLDSFKEEFKKINGNNWEEIRDQYSFAQDEIIEALTNCHFQSRESSERMFESDGQNYHLDVEKFAKKIEKYCKSKGKSHQVIFLIDEIGQYIGDNSQLMLNLQTVVEELGTILKGKAWVIITSQADIDTALKGVTDKNKKQDFSKIQARFDTRLSLSSANVDEVIKKRILKKKEEHTEMLASFYAEKKIILKNLISFSQGSAEMKNYGGEEDFVSVYPFVPYQFNILQKVFEKIRSTGFTGKHLAKGERSMLNAYKESAEKCGNSDIGALVPFYSFYDTIESFLDPIIIRTVRQADTNGNLEKLDCEIIKTLFMIRHVKEIQPTLDNIVVLSITDVDEDKLKLKEKVAAALGRLEKETLINKSSDTFHFLTNEEQEINREIKSIDVERHKILQEVYDEIFTSNTICRSSYGEYKFNRSVDDKITTSAHADLTIRFLTPLSPESLRSSGQQSFEGANLSDIDSTDTLLFIFPETSPFVSQIESYLQIDRYLTQNGSSRNDPEMQTILLSKKQESEKLKQLSKIEICESVKAAKIFIDSAEVTGIDASNPKDMIKEGYERLVKNVYRKASYVTREFESEHDIIRMLNSDDLERFGFGRSDTNTLALDEVLNYIIIRDERKTAVVLGDLKNNFMKKPYGWKSSTISGLVATLYMGGEITLRYQKTYLSRNPEEITKYLVRPEHSDKVFIEVRKKTDIEVIHAVKSVFRETFGKTDIPEKENDLFEYAQKIFDEQIRILSGISVKYSEEGRYPGKERVEEYSRLLHELVNISEPSAFLQKVSDEKDELINLHRDAEPVILFFEGPQSAIFKRILEKVDGYRRNAQFLDEERVRDLTELEGILSSDEPYSQIRHLPQFESRIKSSLSGSCEALKDEYGRELDLIRADLQRDLTFTYHFSEDEINSVLETFAASETRVTTSDDCAEVKLQIGNLKDLSKKAYDKINDLDSQRKEKLSGVKEEKAIVPPTIIDNTSFFKTSADIETGRDLDEYLSSIRNKMKKILTTHKIRVR